ncbi:MAG: nucleotidyltransferase family protein [Gammaproteobacteria bacterium]|nr:nucleotidyltransferase family protein [Gammaproteobacteria bacterium]
MKAMILAAGRGERLRPLTNHTPKPLLQAGKYRLIEYLIQDLVKAGIADIIINYAHLGEQFPSVLGDGERYGATLRYSPEPEGGLETAGGIIKALPLLGNEPFLIINGDIWTDFPFERLINSNLELDTLCQLVMVANPGHNPSGDFALTESGHLAINGDTKYTYSGIGIYHPALFTNYEPQRLALKPVLLQAIGAQAAKAIYYPGQWSDIGTIERLEQLKLQLS